MKSIYKFALLGLLTLGISSCSEDQLETTPSTSVDTEQLMGSTSKAIASLNGIYRMLYSVGYTSGWESEEMGITAFNHVADLMGEDQIQQSSGSGWFYYDYLYMVKSDYTHNAGRPYGTWNFFYTIISNANYLIAADDTMVGEEKDKNYIVGQAYALRALGYFYLSQYYAQTIVGHEDDPCVPLYTEPTTKETKGKGRATNAVVYALIDSDITTAIEKLSHAKTTRDSKSHLGLAEVYGLAARVALVEEKWKDAKKYAELAIDGAQKEGLEITEVNNFLGVNNAASKNVMWGLKIVADQSQALASYFSHMDASAGKYGAAARVQINRELYDSMDAADARRVWWNPNDSHNKSNGYQQEKFKFSNQSTYEGDYVLMRVEEMYLIKAEAQCMLDDDEGAQATLNEYMKTRVADYNCTKTGKAIAETSDPAKATGSLREEIINQRRIELWGEFGRLYDLRRLHQGVYRSVEQGHSAAAVYYASGTEDPENTRWLMTIPQSEFDGNSALDPVKDQNPMN